MGNRVSIPVRVVRPSETQRTLPQTGTQAPRQSTTYPIQEAYVEPQPEAEENALPAATKPVENTTALEAEQHDVDEWRDRALRLQADMDNYRKRQQRIARDQIEAERQRLLGAFLGVVDNLERALLAPVDDGKALRQGVELTHRAALQFLKQEGVEQLQVKGQAFDPNWHEAVATLEHHGSQAAPGTVVQVTHPGYRLGERLLRPAKVVVAV